MGGWLGQHPVRLAPSVHFFSSKNPPIRQPEVEVALAGGRSRADAHEDIAVDAERGNRLELCEEARGVLVTVSLDVADLDVAC